MQQQLNFKRKLVISSAISMIILLISSTASYLSIQKLVESNAQVDHTQEVISHLNSAYTDMVEAQNTMRGFIYTARTTFLEDYRVSEISAKANLKKVKQLTSDNLEQQKIVEKLIADAEVFYNYLDAKIAQKQQGLTVEADDLIEGKARMEVILEATKAMLATEDKLLVERNNSAQTYASTSVILIVAAALLALLISFYFFTRILQDFSERTKLTQQLRDKENEINTRISLISGIASQIANGNYAVRVNDEESDELGIVSDSLNEMASSLEGSFNRLSDSEWKQSGLAQLNSVMMGDKDKTQLTNDIITFLCEYTAANSGILFIAEDDILYPTAGFAADTSRTPIPFGHGLSGQVAHSGKTMQLKGLKADQMRLSYALGDAVPAHVIAIPLIDFAVEGVLEVASLKSFSERNTDFIQSVINPIGVALRSARNRQRVQELLEETEAQAEELKTQHSELENINAELEIQAEKLQASEEELRVQQEELIQTNEELSERSALLEERNLEIQKKSEELEISTRYKSEFLANMSHELRTPLNSILLLSRLLSENNDKNMSDEQIEFAKVINSSGNGLLGLIDEILDLSKIEAGKMDLELLDTPLEEVTGSMKSLFDQMAKEKKIKFTIDTKDAPLVIKTDKMRLEQILKNLISNAIKFTEKGSVTLSVKKDPENDKQILFSVTDTGIGIPYDKQASIFEAFQQADGSTKRKYGGTGLGLSISRQLSRLLKGDIRLKSDAENGSTFTLVLPVSGSSAVAISKLEQPKPSATVEIPQSEKGDATYLADTIPENVPDDRDEILESDKVILIVEDDVPFAKSLLQFTRQRGYKGIVSVRGDQVLDLALVYNPIGILLDIQLPVKSGWEVMSELKNHKQTKHIPVHIMSSLNVRQESLLKGAVNFLDKPVAFEQIPEVFRRIEQILSRDSQKVLIIEDNSKHAEALAYFLETYNINSEIKSDIGDGMNTLKREDVNCVILDMGIPDKTGYEMLEQMKRDNQLEGLPVIVFTGKSLSMKEEMKIKKFADSIVVKTAHSYQRMLDEVSLFLHLVEENKKGNRSERQKQNQLNNILSDKTVLVVDDDVRNIYSLTKALEVLKMKVLTAIDGAEALKILKENPQTDVVLLDMMMPNMDGYETAQRIRSNARHKNLPVIAVTAKAMMGDREKCIKAGASDYITKPVDVDQLLSLLRVWLYNKS